MRIDNIYIKSTPKTPEIDFNCNTGELILSGKSIPENAAKVYEDLLKWVLEYIKSPKVVTNLRLNLDYFNTASAIWLSKIVAKLASIKKNNYTLLLHLYFSIDDFENMEEDDLRDELYPFINMIENPHLSVGIKIYGTDETGRILKDSTVLL